VPTCAQRGGLAPQTFARAAMVGRLGDGMLDLRNTVEMESPSLVPDEPVDRAHLFRMTLGDHSLEGEVLRLFERQSEMLLGRMANAEPACIKALAHTLNGSARGIGAWRVARAAEAVELAADGGADCACAIQGLRTAIDETLVVIADLLRVH
jgi:hypothetical protein